MTLALARSLLLADAVTPDALAQALLFSATRGTTLVRALLATRAIDARRLEAQLEHGEAPVLRHVAPVLSLVQELPPGLCERLLAIPVRQDPRTGTVDVAVVDARDPHPVGEIAHWLGAPVRVVRTSLVAMDSALRRLHVRPIEPGPKALAPPIWVPPVTDAPRETTKTPAYGSPAVDGSRPFGEGDEQMQTDVGVAPPPDPHFPFALTRRSAPPEVEARAPDPRVEDEWSMPTLPRVSKPHRPATLPPPNPPRGKTSRPPPRPGSRPPTGPPPLPRGGPFTTRPSWPPPRKPSSAPPPPPPSSDREPVLDLQRRRSGPPTAPNAPAPPFDEVATALAAIRAATDRDAILEQVVQGMRAVARKVLVLAARRDLLVGWTCTPEMADRATLRAARVSPALSAVLGAALDADDALLARIPKDATHAPLLSTLHAAPAGEVGLIPIRVEGKSIALVVVDEMGDTLEATRRLEQVARAAGLALTKLLRDKRR